MKITQEGAMFVLAAGEFRQNSITKQPDISPSEGDDASISQ